MLNERQQAGWNRMLAEARLHGVETEPDPWRWMIIDHRSAAALHAAWMDADHAVMVQMDEYGHYELVVAEVSIIHNSSDDACDCGPCQEDRQ